MVTRIAPVAGLFVLAPFVGEFLLGNLTLDELGLGVVLAPMYGFGAVLVREVARRWGGGWASIGLLAAAYALVEEGPVDQLLWNDSYAGQDLLHGPSYLPALGMGVELTQAVLALHTVWSICVPIALVEAFVPDRRPWLGRIGLAVVGVLFLLGGGLVFWGNYSVEHFVASPWQLGGVVAVVVGLIAGAYRFRGWHPSTVDGEAPSPWLVGVVALLGTSAYWGPAVLLTADWYEWVGVVVWCLVAVAGVRLVARWSGTRGWDDRHRFALAAGATLTYVWTAFPTRPESGGQDFAANAVFGAIGLLVLALAGRAVAARRVETEPIG
jgi:hypothetical protein